MNSCMKLKFETVDVIYSTLFSPLLLFDGEQKVTSLKKHHIERKVRPEYEFHLCSDIIIKKLRVINYT